MLLCRAEIEATRVSYSGETPATGVRVLQGEEDT